MGRWAQAKRRGGRAPAVAALGPPPAPYLSVFGGQLHQEAAGLDDTGGLIRLYLSESPEGPWILESEKAWQFVYDWGNPLIWEGQYAACTEVGNDSTYTGESPYSAALLL